MNVSTPNVDLSVFFPFRNCSYEFLSRAQGLGRCVKYNTGEPVLLSGSPAKHCGVIVSGQAVVFKIDENKKRYQLCLDEGCYIGLEMLSENAVYNGKVVALTDLEVFFWNEEGLTELLNASSDFSHALRMLNEGKTYQEQWLIPETDVTDPVLCSLPSHWLTAAVPAAGVILVLFVCLWACSMMVRRYPIAWVLMIGAILGAGSLLYRVIQRRSDERLIVTSRNFIMLPGPDGSEMSVTRLNSVQRLTVHQNFFERMLRIGKIELLTEAGLSETHLIPEPELTAVLIRYFSEQSSGGRPVILKAGQESGRRTIPEPKKNDTGSDAALKNSAAFAAGKGNEERPEFRRAVPNFQTIEFRAHWALLVKMLIKPLLVLAAVVLAAKIFRTAVFWGDIQKILLIIAAGALTAVVYQFSAWRNHRFYIEEDRVRDYSRKPLTGEDQNVAMNNKIHSVRFEKKGFFQVLLNYGTVYILAGEGELSFDYVGDPQSVQQQIMDNCARFEAKRMVDAETRQREYINGLINGIRKETDDPAASDRFPY